MAISQEWVIRTDEGEYNVVFISRFGLGDKYKCKLTVNHETVFEDVILRPGQTMPVLIGDREYTLVFDGEKADLSADGFFVGSKKPDESKKFHQVCFVLTFVSAILLLLSIRKPINLQVGSFILILSFFYRSGFINPYLKLVLHIISVVNVAGLGVLAWCGI